MKLTTFLLGAIAGTFVTASLLLAAEVFRAYRENTEQDPWNEHSSEEAPHKQPFDWELWKTADELNAERRAKQEFYTRDQPDTEDDDR